MGLGVKGVGPGGTQERNWGVRKRVYKTYVTVSNNQKQTVRVTASKSYGSVRNVTGIKRNVCNPSVQVK